MTDLSLTIAPKSDQLNADDLIAGPRTITITRVSGRDNAEQPIAINFEGDGGKPYMPCKSMRRVLVQVWGKDGNQFVGRALTLYRDPAVKFGGLDVGGIRISHMSHIDEPVTMALTATRASRKPYTVRPLAQQQAKPKDDPAAKWAAGYIAKLKSGAPQGQLLAFIAEKKDKLAELRAKRPELASQIDLALSNAIAPDDGFDFEEGKPDDAHGDQRDGVLDQALAAIEKATTREMVDAIVNEAADRLTDQEHETLRSAAVDRIADLQPTVVE